MLTKNGILSTYQTIQRNIYKTPLIHAPLLSKISGAEVFLKMEHLQVSGSFKIRGVLSKIGSLKQEDFGKTFVAASTGNHAAAFAYASKKVGFKGILYLPERTSKAKIRALEQYDVEKRFFGKSSMETEVKATEIAKAINGVLIHPYNDEQIIKGQGTIGVEIKEQLPEVDAILTPIGGGGLASGLCILFQNRDVQIIGCQPENGAEMYESIQKNDIVAPCTLHTISDATSGGIEANAITFDICKKYLSDFELLDELSIKRAVAFIVKYHQTIVEPASVLPVAALLNSKKYQGKKAVLILTGKKIDQDLLTKILIEHGNDY